MDRKATGESKGVKKKPKRRLVLSRFFRENHERNRANGKQRMDRLGMNSVSSNGKYSPTEVSDIRNRSTVPSGSCSVPENAQRSAVITIHSEDDNDKIGGSIETGAEKSNEKICPIEKFDAFFDDNEFGQLEVDFCNGSTETKFVDRMDVITADNKKEQPAVRIGSPSVVSEWTDKGLPLYYKWREWTDDDEKWFNENVYISTTKEMSDNAVNRTANDIESNEQTLELKFTGEDKNTPKPQHTDDSDRNNETKQRLEIEFATKENDDLGQFDARSYFDTDDEALFELLEFENDQNRQETESVNDGAKLGGPIQDDRPVYKYHDGVHSYNDENVSFTYTSESTGENNFGKFLDDGEDEMFINLRSE